MTQNNNIRKIFEGTINLITFSISNPPGLTKARIRKVITGDKSFFQEERILNKKAYHRNLEKEDLPKFFITLMKEEFKNAVIYTTEADYYIRRTKKGNLSVMKREATKADLSPDMHNVKKNYLIPEGKPVDFLVKLGIMDKDGKIYKKHYSKFRQINRFLELVDDENEIFKGNETVAIADLCCGKGYLTLALHYFFTVIKGIKTVITGMDLKEDVVNKLNSIVYDLSLEGIEFQYGDIRDAELNKPDMVVALHACDVATDFALSKAVEAGTDLIMAVPCCQHELFNQIKSEDLSSILKYGIMKDKFTELATNALRGLALEARGYQVKMIEFTSTEHTAKNILIKALKTNNENLKAMDEFNELTAKLNVVCSAEQIIKLNQDK